MGLLKKVALRQNQTMRTNLLMMLPVLFLALTIQSQTHEISYGDKKYMGKVYLILGESKQSVERFVLNKNVPDGEWKIYRSEKKQQLKSEGAVKKGLKDGIWKDYGKNGSLSKTTEYRAGVMHGKEVYYNQKTGEPLLQYEYKNGAKDGYYFINYANGKKWQDGYFTAGTPNGTWNNWDKKGKLVRTVTYSTGKFVKEETH